ncbi:MAG TPA: ABC transporter permease [Vicinamibacterales bacterium]|jgi:predicted permease
MARFFGIRRLFRLPPSQDDVGSDVEREIAFHVDERTKELVARGMDPGTARATAVHEFGDLGEAKAELEQIGLRRVHRAQRADWWGDLRQDLRHGARQLAAAPLFSLLAILTLALSIGANSAIFGVVKSVLLDALPYADADRLVRVYSQFTDNPQSRGPLSAGTVADIARRQRSFDRLAAFQFGTGEGVFGDETGPRVVRIGWVEPGFFETLGVRPVLGRNFRKDEGTNGLVPVSAGQLSREVPRVVILSHAAWQGLLASDPHVLGREVQVLGIPRTVIGVLPPDYAGPMGEADVYFAFDLAPVVDDVRVARRAGWLGLVARLRPEVSHDAAATEVGTIWADLVRAYPADNGTQVVTTMPLRDWMVGETRIPLLVVMASAGFVLFIACANLAGALLSRTLTRRKEFAVRVAIGAGRGRLIRQLLTESTLLALVGGVAGLLLAVLLLRLLQWLALPILPAYAELSLDAGAVFVTALLTLSTGIIFGLSPALAAARPNLQGMLRDESRSASEGRRAQRLRGVLVAGQIALCVSLLSGAGLLGRSLWAMSTKPPGFNPDGVLTAALRLSPYSYPTPQARMQFFDQFLDRLRALPGVDAVALATSIPTNVGNRVSFSIVGRPWPNDAEPFVLFTTVSDDYFATLSIPLQRGRLFDARDQPNTTPVVVISESMARLYWPDGDALGARVRMGGSPNAPPIEVIGIVRDVRNDPARPDAEPMAYGSMRPNPAPIGRILLRTQGDPLAFVSAIERELAALDRGIPLNRAMTLHAVMGEGLIGRRLPVVLIGTFAALALLLASVGVYAMFVSLGAAREKEFGVRMALGSRPRAIAALMLRQGAGWMAAGLIGGALGVVLVVQLVRDLLYEVGPFDPIALGLAGASLAACAAIALIVPVRRATRVDPVIALRVY